MIWSNFVNRLAITLRRRGLATAIVYGLSLAVRFTSATGEEVELPAQSVQTAKPAISILMETSPRLPYEDWAPKATQFIGFRSGWPLGSPGCRSGM
jgi:hypothetical protein